MKLYSENNFYKLYQGNMLEMLDDIEENSIDSIVTDPPYELNFMGKGWDNAGVSFQPDTWKKCYEVLKPGGYLLAFGGSRTFHRIACAIEDAGFEMRDTIMWLYGSGFPKSMSLGKVIEGKQVLGSANVRDIKKLDGDKEIVSGGWISNEFEQGKRDKEYDQIKTNVNYKTELGKKWDGWGTCLKPSFEPIIVARKPFKGSLVDNVIENGVGGLNIDECRVGTEKIGGGTMPDFKYTGKKQKELGNGNKLTFGQVSNAPRIECEEHEGRFPANTILTYDETDYDEVCGGFPESKGCRPHVIKSNVDKYDGWGSITKRNGELVGYADTNTSASRYFYCAKASKKDRNEGLESLKQQRNQHPTVKPCDLMQYLVRLVTPNGGTILDPFNGSGSTGKAVMYENKEQDKGYKYIGIELTEEYLPISKARIEYVCKDLDVVQTTLDLSDLD